MDAEIADLIPGFLENRRKDVASIMEAVDRNDFETVRFLGHSMKGAGGGYGFDAITELGAALEQAAKDNDADVIRKHVGNLASYLARVAVVSE